MLVIDAFAFCRNGLRQSGSFPLSDLARLGAECVSGEGEIGWTLVGNAGSVVGRDSGSLQLVQRAKGLLTLHLAISGTVQLLCQRCLTPYAFHLQSDSTIVLAENEEIADELDGILQDEKAEVVVASKEFDVIALLEDEALLALPLSPKHEVCPKAENGHVEKNTATENTQKESPFAALKGKLKK